MGPRSCDRGEAYPVTARLPGSSTLQWGRGHVTAESRSLSFAPIARAFALQWGRGHVTAESKKLRNGRPISREASMGPRSCDRGERQPTTPLTCLPAASMGPRSCDRGENARSHRSGFSHTPLQWGRGHVTAERSLPGPARQMG